MTDPEKEEHLEKFILESVMVFEIPIVFPDFVQFFEDKLKQIPEEHRQNSLIWIPITQDDGVEISFSRPETEREKFTRLQADREKENQIRLRELRELARLKKKYEQNR